MKYLRKFESFENKEDNQDPAEVASDIIKMTTGEDVSKEEVKSSVEDAVEKGEEELEEAPKNEGVMDFLNWWWEIMQQQQYNPGTLDYNMTISAFGAWLATLAAGIGASTGLYKIGKAIRGLFKGKEVDFTKEVEKYSKKHNIDLSKVDPSSEEGKKILADMLKDLNK